MVVYRYSSVDFETDFSRVKKQASGSGSGSIVGGATRSTAVAMTALGVDQSAAGVTPGSMLCNVVFGSVPTQCAMLVMRETLTPAEASILCTAASMGPDSIGLALDNRVRAKVVPNAQNVDSAVVATYSLTGCPNSGGGSRHLLQLLNPPTALSVYLVQTIVAHLPSTAPTSTVRIDMQAITRTSNVENGTIVIQWDPTGGGAYVVIEELNYRDTWNDTVVHGTTAPHVLVTNVSIRTAVQVTPPPSSITYDQYLSMFYDHESAGSRCAMSFGIIVINLLLASSMIAAIMQ